MIHTGAGFAAACSLASSALANARGTFFQFVSQRKVCDGIARRIADVVVHAARQEILDRAVVHQVSDTGEAVRVPGCLEKESRCAHGQAWQRTVHARRHDARRSRIEFDQRRCRRQASFGANGDVVFVAGMPNGMAVAR